MRRTLAATLMLGIAAPLPAQALRCTVPATLPAPRLYGPMESEPSRPLAVGAHTLALTWSPQYCRSHGNGKGGLQCSEGTRFGFVLHGLWPDGQGRQWPQYCAPVDEPLPPSVIARQFCTTPSPDLIQHEWTKHGTCMSRDPAAYFAEGRRLFDGLKFPNMAALSRRRDLTVGDFMVAFAAANADVPGLVPASVRVRITRDKWLEEVWLCLDRNRRFARCGRQQGGGYAPALRLKIWRGETPSGRLLPSPDGAGRGVGG